MPTDDEMLALNKLTGRVHQYKGTALGGVGHERTDVGIGIIPCGCDGFEEAVETDSVVMIRGRHLERGIWEAAPCLQEGDDAD